METLLSALPSMGYKPDRHFSNEAAEWKGLSAQKIVGGK
jgi:hypothetical protein